MSVNSVLSRAESVKNLPTKYESKEYIKNFFGEESKNSIFLESS